MTERRKGIGEGYKVRGGGLSTLSRLRAIHVGGLRPKDVGLPEVVTGKEPILKPEEEKNG